MHFHSRRNGFTLFQLLILIALFAMGFALLLPAIANARLQAARMASANNMKQLGLAVHNYAATYNDFFPPGMDKLGFSAAAYLLPYIEQANVFNQIDFKQAPTDKANAQARATVVKVFLNPLDPVKNVTMDAGATNYLFCAGSQPVLGPNDGIFAVGAKWKIGNIPDGTSNTMLIGETLKGDSGVNATTVARQHVELKADALKGIKADAGVDDWKNNKNIAADRCAAWMDGKFLQGTFTGTRTVNDERPDVTCVGQGGFSGLRSLSNDVWICMADGSVRKLSSKVPLNVIQLLANTSDGMVLPDF
jgi:hypothetical protein